ncbi:hypothetical protein EHI8A_114430 [Entamoeba histolytica HM-1:IMSS-B]|uniref:Uncharacterized protein n=6 Tax=Entamoeba histolytica TaxID=5759 RepID=B1N2Z1_ENTH1|nr:hypothetical protein EHI_035730 [Entamoeba histolytica HM-1:IMSS]EMD45095.1 Hypothetical protein EHI5A_021570 [Entamoeba histolytica KU27]EMH77033.1 hypothetical protein EHI8A_114430 [Entamoeba histolytica HM-1:IMSS-B]EMS11170.1 hypothetical protein KM1_028010 [Entamoeba histolytica HM-3:IMSS]ENY60612.1 hypothetical protein EHI7A_101630 [Entamoeba histolytica HM-1:IMSS-A]GAT93662.1 hypothetical protein CL6EHI_035730 [Entamoeba histolytica]|eukprot:XP_001913557.1 hypothetical protein EHI_035730 [Entamoeba histolytica HM-1:IMSS]
MVRLLIFTIVITLFAYCQGAIIVDYGYEHISVAWYSNNRIDILDDSHGNRNIYSKIAYRCKRQDLIYGQQAQSMIGNQLINTISPLYNEMEQIENCTIHQDFTSLLALQMDNLFYKLDNENNTRISLTNLFSIDSRHSSYFIIPSSFTPYDIDRIRLILPEVQFITKHKLHAGMILGAVSKRIIDMKDEYLMIDCGAHETAITKVKMINGTQFSIISSDIIPLSVHTLNKKLASLVGSVRGVLENHNFMNQINELRVKLSSNQEITMFIEELEKNVTITRDQFNTVIADDLKPLENILNTIKKELNENSTIFVIGGLSYTPRIKEVIEQTVGNYSIRLSGDQYLMESAKILITLENMLESPMNITDIIPYPINIKVNEQEMPFINNERQITLDQVYNIPLGKTNRLEFIADMSGTNRSVRIYSIEKMEKDTNATIHFNSIEKGFISSIKIENSTIQLIPTFNASNIKEEIKEQREKDQTKRKSEAAVIKKRQEYEMLLNDFKQYITSGIDDIKNVESIFVDVERRVVWLEDQLDLTLEDIEKEYNEFKTKYEKELDLYFDFQMFNLRMESIGTKIGNVIEEMRVLRMSQGQEYAKRINDAIQHTSNKKADRDSFEVLINKLYDEMVNKVNKKKRSVTLRGYWQIFGYVVVAILIVLILYLSFFKSKKSTAIKRLHKKQH